MFCFVVQSLWGENVSVFTPLHNTHTHASIVLYLRDHLIGRRDRTSIIDRSIAAWKKWSFQEVVSHGRAKRTLAQTSWSSRRQKNTVLLCLVICKVHFAQALSVIATNTEAIGSTFEWTANIWQLERPNYRISQRRRRLRLSYYARCSLRTFLTCYKNDCHLFICTVQLPFCTSFVTIL